MSGLVQVATYSNMEEALIARGFLQSNDIDASLADLHTVAAFASNSLLGDNRLYVPRHQEAQARALLRGVADGGSSPEISHACRACGAAEFRMRKRNAITTIFGLNAKLECAVCGTPATKED